MVFMPKVIFAPWREENRILGRIFGKNKSTHKFTQKQRPVNMFQNWDRLLFRVIEAVILMVSEQKYLIIYARRHLTKPLIWW
jgi:hypothetical protein